jgi:hypothetical protein
VETDKGWTAILKCLKTDIVRTSLITFLMLIPLPGIKNLEVYSWENRTLLYIMLWKLNSMGIIKLWYPPNTGYNLHCDSLAKGEIWSHIAKNKDWFRYIIKILWQGYRYFGSFVIPWPMLVSIGFTFIF